MNSHCTIYYEGEISTLPGERLGVIGQYDAPDSAAGKSALDDACAALSARGCTLAVGPMDGNTWRRYRFMTGGEDREPPFFLEPTNPAEYPAHWFAAGFTPLAEYTSALTDNMTLTDARIPRITERLRGQGLTLRSVTVARVDEDLHAIYELSLLSFRRNFLYTPLAEAEFREQYQRILPFVRPEITLMAHAADGTLVGFLFAVPDLHEVQRGEPLRTVIVKTVAILPGREWAGLGLLLLDTCHKAARALGCTRAIHALMHESNASRNVSGAYSGRTIRRYTLYARRLAPSLGDGAAAV